VCAIRKASWLSKLVPWAMAGFSGCCKVIPVPWKKSGGPLGLADAMGRRGYQDEVGEMDRMGMVGAAREIALLMNEAKAKGSAIFKAGRISIECVNLYTEVIWKVANKVADEGVATRIIARYLQEEATDRTVVRKG
jgi:hypothetical protein